MSARRWGATAGAALAATGTFLYVRLFAGIFLAAGDGAAVLPTVLAFVAAAAAALVVLRERPGDGALPGAVRGALVAGSLGFALGFVGPMLLAPESGQGPLLGVFITGPLGAIVGAILGARRSARGAGTTT